MSCFSTTFESSVKLLLSGRCIAGDHSSVIFSSEVLGCVSHEASGRERSSECTVEIMPCPGCWCWFLCATTTCVMHSETLPWISQPYFVHKLTHRWRRSTKTVFKPVSFHLKKVSQCGALLLVGILRSVAAAAASRSRLGTYKSATTTSNRGGIISSGELSQLTLGLLCAKHIIDSFECIQRQCAVWQKSCVEITKCHQHHEAIEIVLTWLITDLSAYEV